MRIRRFFGHSENAVRGQIRIAISTYLLAAILRKRLKIDRSMAEILHIFNAVQFENIPISMLFDKNSSVKINPVSLKGPFLPSF